MDTRQGRRLHVRTPVGQRGCEGAAGGGEVAGPHRLFLGGREGGVGMIALSVGFSAMLLA